MFNNNISFFIEQYLELICKEPSFLKKYNEVEILKRLKKIGYFCGMDYASTDIYNFLLYISRYDHVRTTARLTYRYTKDKTKTLAALFHDIVPCFSHVIDYMNKDYSTQESTEAKTREIMYGSLELRKLLDSDGIDIEDIIDFKKYSIVDNERPMMCADRLDGIILTSYAWTKQIGLSDIKDILNNTCIYLNEYNKEEIGFRNKNIALKVFELNNMIDDYCHSNSDNYMMDLLSKITKYAIDKNIITYDELYYIDEETLFRYFIKLSDNDIYFKEMLDNFLHIKKCDIPDIYLPNVKRRTINPLVNGKRYM